MKKFIYLKDPGLIYDLAFVFFWKYNQERFFELFSITDPEEQAFYENTLPPLAPESDELSLFFCAGEDKRCFFPQGFFRSFLLWQFFYQFVLYLLLLLIKLILQISQGPLNFYYLYFSLSSVFPFLLLDSLKCKVENRNYCYKGLQMGE